MATVRSILLVEDQAVIALDGKATLEKRGYRVLWARSGEEGVELALGADPPDLVLMDIDLGPGMDGTEAARRILASRDLPIIFLSAHTEPAVVERTEAISSYGYVTKSAGPTVLDASIKMAFRLFEARREISGQAADLRAKNQVLEGIMEHFPGSVFWKDRDSVYLGCNTEEAHASGAASPAEVIGKTDFELGWKDHPPEFYRESDRAVMESGQAMLHREYSYHRRDGRLVWVETSKVPLFGEDGRIEGVFGVAVDVTARKLKEEALRESEARLALVLDKLGAAVFMKDRSYRYTYVNRRVAELFRREPAEIVGRGDEDFFSPASVAEIRASDRPVLEEGRTVSREEVDLEAADGKPRSYWAVKLPLRDAEGAITGLCGISSDITDRRRAEEEVRRLLAEKEILLGELQHRVKNNLASVRALLDFQAEAAHVPEAAAALREASGRVDSIALLYERLHGAGRISDLSFAEYLPPLVAQTLALFPAGSRVRLETRVDDVSLDPRTLASLGIMVNELVTNALKHAYGGREAGSLRVAAIREGQRLVILVEDDGPGLPAGGASPGGFGLSLVRAICRELGAELSFQEGGGLRVRVSFEPR